MHNLFSIINYIAMTDASFKSSQNCVELLSNRLPLTSLGDKFLQDVKFILVPWLVTFRIMDD